MKLTLKCYSDAGCWCLTGLLVLVPLGYACSGVAVSTKEIDTLPPNILSCFEETHHLPRQSDPTCSPGAPTVESIVLTPNRFFLGTVDAIINGLELLALTSDNGFVQRSAAGALSVAGIRGTSGSGRPLPGIVDRLESVYWASDDSVIRGAIVRGIARQADRPRTIEFLKNVILEARPKEGGEHRPPPAYRALVELELLGEEGRRVLWDLHAGGQVRNDLARAHVEYLALHSFGESFPSNCPPREARNVRAFDPSHPEVLVGTYELIMVSDWEDDRGMRRKGRMELWPTDSLRYRVTRPIYGAAEINLSLMNVPTTEGLEHLSSRDPNAPGLLLNDDRLELAPPPLGSIYMDASGTSLEVDSLSDGGFWGDWRSWFGNFHLVGDVGQALPNPYGHFCAIREIDADEAQKR